MMHVIGRVHLFLSLCCFFFIELTSYAQTQHWTTVINIPSKEREFQQALQQYQEEDYKAAFVGFETLSNTRELHQRMTASLLMTGKSLYHVAHYTDALSYFDKLIDKYPQSQYIDDARYAKALCDYRLGNYIRSVVHALWAADWSADSRLVTKSKKLANMTMQSGLSLNEMYKLLSVANGRHSASLVTLELARKEMAEGSREKAVSLLTAYKSKYGSKQYIPQIDRLLKEAQTRVGMSLKVGVILPLTGFYSDEGRGVLRGVKFAQSQSQQQGIEVQLELWDSESNMVKAIHGVNKLIKKDRVHAIIGELESDITAGIGALASLKGVPVIGPTATENRVSTVGESVFQLNSSLETKGSAIAEYAFHTLGMRTFATLAPADAYGQEMIDSFTSKIDQLGGRIVAQSWYYSGNEDLNLSRQFKHIRAAAFAYDSTDVEKLIEEAEENGEDLDEKDIPVHSIDAVFFPVYAEDIPYCAPQFALSNIRAQILGGEYWDDLDVLQGRQVEQYIHGVIFVSDYFPDEESRDFLNFRNQFRLKMKKKPERWEVFGYDALTVLKDIFGDGAKTGRQVTQRLKTLSGYQGIKGGISFVGNMRINKEVHFLQFLNGQIVKHRSLAN
ncbi:MAG: penicillin-binding protein activator [bacterium]